MYILCSTPACILSYISTCTRTQTHIPAYIQTDSQADRQVHRQTDIHAGGQEYIYNIHAYMHIIYIWTIHDMTAAEQRPRN